MLRLLLHAFVWLTIYTATGCTRHVDVIILKAPSSIEYAEVMEGL